MEPLHIIQHPTNAEHRALLAKFWTPSAVPMPKRDDYVIPELMAKRVKAHRALMAGLARLNERQVA